MNDILLNVALSSPTSNHLVTKVFMYQSNIPTKLDKNSMTKADWVKARTQELYDMLPQTTLEERSSFTEIRDEIIDINYAFFGYVAKNRYVSDPQVTYEDKLQSALLNFCKMWAKYKFEPRYRSDLSFGVFFKPRLSECICREFNTVKYSLRREVCQKAAVQLGKHWGKVVKDDLKNVNLPPNEMRILESVFNTQYGVSYEDLSENTGGFGGSNHRFSSDINVENLYTENYTEIEDLIIHEMIEQESKLDDAYLLKMSEIYTIPYIDLYHARPIGEAKLQAQLEHAMFINEAFEEGCELKGSVNSNSSDED